jgi:hypothetical protein
LKEDFKKAIQNSYEQGYSCAELIENKEYKLFLSNKQEISLNREFKEIYIFCVISDHYPALSFQCHQLLQVHKSKKILYPFVMDVFLLDAMTEMLSTPLQFLSYINRRVRYADQIIASHELTILSYHLKNNLWIDEEYSNLSLADDISIDLDIAMAVRRAGIQGIDTPEGILTKFRGKTIGNLISSIENSSEATMIDLGFLLLMLSEEASDQLNFGIDKITALTTLDGKSHDFTMSIDEGSTGITIHCNNDPTAKHNLNKHIEKRKYIHKAKEWFGIFINHKNKQMEFCIKLNYEWKQSDHMDRVIPHSMYSQTIVEQPDQRTKLVNNKVGRNEKCPCGSGKKYKKCCLKSSWDL